jgi:hypothetical protein
LQESLSAGEIVLHLIWLAVLALTGLVRVVEAVILAAGVPSIPSIKDRNWASWPRKRVCVSGAREEATR